MDASTWIEDYARELGLEPPTEEEKTALLSLASVAANASERLAAPICCWLVARSGKSPADGLVLARRLAGPGTGPGGA